MAAVVKPEPIPQDRARSNMHARVSGLESAFRSQRPLLNQISDYMAPYRGQWDTPGGKRQDQRGKMRGQKIINNAAGRSFQILSSGMMTGLTSPSRPWFRLTTQDPDLAEFTPVRMWLDDVARAMRTVFARSNLYNVLPSIYGELAPFGTAALLEVDDPESVVRFYPFTIGSFAIAQDDRLIVDTFSRRYVPTVRQVAARFGLENASERVKQAYRKGKFEEHVECIHLIQPNLGQRIGGFGVSGMPYIEEYWEAQSDKQEPLYRGGYHERALFVPRWDVTGDALWGKGLGHDVIGDVKQLQFLERRKEDVLEKHTAPPLEAGIELRGKSISLLSGAVNYTNPGQTGGAQIKPIVQTHPSAYQYAADDIRQLEQRIRSALYEDLFLMLANDTRSGITAREVEERHQEKMLVLGPVLERLNEELLDPIIDRTYAILARRSEPVWNGVLDGVPLIPPPPEEVQMQGLRVEYTSILAQAAKATHTRGLEAFGMFVGNLAGAWPSVLDKVDPDQMVDEYADAQGVPARVVRSDAAVAEIREGKAQQARMQQMAQMAKPVADAARAMKDASEAVPQEGSIASNLAGSLMGGAGGS